MMGLIGQHLLMAHHNYQVHGGINFATTPTIGYMQAHSKEHFNGQIAEVIIFDKAISTEERIRIHNYLSNKWDLTTSIDSDGDGFLDAVEKGKWIRVQ